MADYISTKYKAIYAECNAAYNELLHLYPTKLDLTKTYRYQKWKKETIANPPSEIQPVPSENQNVQSVPSQNQNVQSVPSENQNVQSSETESVPNPIQNVQIQPFENQVEIGNPEEASLDEMELAVNNIIREFEKDDEIMGYLNQIEHNEQDEPFW